MAATLMLESVADKVEPRSDLSRGVGTEQALAAVRRLAGALTAEVLAYDPASGTLEPVFASPAGGSGPSMPSLLAAMRAETGLMFNQSRPRWVSEEGEGASLLVKLSDRGAISYFLLLGFADASAVARARIGKLVPDLVTLVKFHVSISTRLHELEERNAAAAEALDHGECGVIAVREDHSVVFANEAASAHLAEEIGLQIRRGVVRPSDRQDAVRFESALDHVIAPPKAEPSKRQRAIVMLLARKDGARPTIIAIAPVRGAHAGAHARGAAAVIYVLQPGQGPLRGLDTLCQLHGLSRVESRLLIHLTGGQTLAEAAGEMRIKIETARAYLKQIFAKTGTHRQTDLVTLMSRYLRAVRGNFDFQPA